MHALYLLRLHELSTRRDALILAAQVQGRRQQDTARRLFEEEKERKKRIAARKGWKGWVEGSPPPSEKLINLDQVTVLAERKTRSGKSFDAIGAGRDGWV